MNKPADVGSATLTGAEAVVEMLAAHGVEVIFGLCGDTGLPLYDALARLRHGMTRSRNGIVCQPLHEAPAPVSEWVA